MGEQGVWHVDAPVAQVTDGAVEIDCVPQDDCRDDEIEAGGAMSLVLEGAVVQFAEAVALLAGRPAALPRRYSRLPAQRS
jgi:hypothetical protein